jgi:hypothetical protein
MKETNDMRGKLRYQRNKKKCEKRVQEDGADNEKLRIVEIRD